MKALRLVQFTDPHLYGSETASLRGVATLPALLQTLAQAQARDWPVDAVLVTGDLVQDDPTGYANFRRVFSNLGKPIYCVPGNHDEPVAMKRELDRAPFVLSGHVDIGPWRIVLLDSCIPGSAGGRLSERTLEELDAALKSAPNKHALVCMHHHPVSMSSRWLDEVGLANPNDLFKVIDRHRNVRAVLWGHVHQSFEGTRKGVRLLATPSTCQQFLPRSDDFAVDHSPPAYRTLELRPDGTIATEVVWVESCVNNGLPISACSSAA
jgi:3',5'-cyclic-AMP phosphodiesterase